MREDIKTIARSLRRNRTEYENILWQAIRNRKFMGKKFLRQYPIQFNYMGNTKYFIADFYCHEKKLIIEIDGKIHERQRDYDELRTYIIRQMGIEVFRIKNEEVENIEEVLNAIGRYLK